MYTECECHGAYRRAVVMEWKDTGIWCRKKLSKVGLTKRPEFVGNFHEGKRHRKDAQKQVRNGQVDDVNIPGCTHIWFPDDGHTNEPISKDAGDDESRVTNQEDD